MCVLASMHDGIFRLFLFMFKDNIVMASSDIIGTGTYVFLQK